MNCRSSLVAGAILAVFAVTMPQSPGQSREEQLQQLLQRFPAADANHDGKLTIEEAQAYRSRLTSPVTPTFSEVHYGPHERQVLDFYQAKSAGPASVIVFIHGGGFVAGDKRMVSPSMVRDAVESGMSLASINYRFVDGQTTLLPMPQRDGARAVQFIRTKAREWNLDPKRVACCGGSAGAGISMWIGFHEDLAAPGSADPVERESTRIQAIGTMGGQGTYDPVRIKELIGGRAHEHPSLVKCYGLKSVEESLHPTPEVQRLYDEASAVTHLTRDDPPLYMTYSEPDIIPPADAKPGQFIHHPNFGRDLKAKMDALGIENVFINGGGTPRTPEPAGGMMGFFQKQFLK